jgi:hypothetical protein
LAAVSSALLVGYEAPRAAKVTSDHEESPSSFAFEQNVGQFDPEVRFAARGAGYAIGLTDEGARLSIARAGGVGGDLLVGLDVHGVAATRSAPVASDRREGRVSTFRGRDPSKWVVGAPRFGRVTYEGVKPGVDLVYRGAESERGFALDAGRLEYDFVVAPGASVDDAALDVKGATALSLDEDGSLLIATPGGALRQLPPIVYQEGDGGTRHTIAGSYRLEGGSRVAFAVGAHDPDRALVIDPVLLYGTYLGGSGFDQANAVAIDATGNVYVVGFTTSPNFPTHDPFGGVDGGNASALSGSLDAFVAKLDPTGQTLLYASYLGGMLEDTATAVAVDSTGNAYVAGRTQSNDFPTTSLAYQAAINGAANAFVVKVAPDGQSLSYSTCLGGSGFDSASAIAVDGSGDAFITGFTQSPDFPTSMNAMQPMLMGTQNVFVTELSPTGTDCGGGVLPNCSPSLAASTYLGGMGNDAATAIALDGKGDVFLAGYTQSSDGFPLKNAYQGTLAGTQNAFVMELAPSISALSVSTYFGGSGQDAANAMAIDASGNVYLVGSTSSPDLPTAKPFRAALDGPEDAFITKFAPGLGSLVYSTYLGGSGADVASALALDAAGEVYVAGQTQSSDFPLVGAFQDKNLATSTPGGDAFFALLGASGQRLVGSTYLGGSGGANALGLGLAEDTAWVVGAAGKGLPVPGALFPTFMAEGAVAQNAFLAQISPEAGTPLDAGMEDAPTDVASSEASTGLGDGGGVKVVGPLPEMTSPPKTTPSTSGCGCRLEGERRAGSGFTPPWVLVWAAVVLGAIARRKSVGSREGLVDRS